MEKYQIFTRCIMDTTASDISFDEQGRCNFCRRYEELSQNKYCLNQEQKEIQTKKLIEKIKKKGKNNEYDCVVGVSGGLDSSYLLYVITQRYGLRALAIHLDNGWNSELAVANINNLCRKLNVDLYTYVIDWEEFKSLQLAFFEANVVDIELLTDLAILAVPYKEAAKRGVKYIISGHNFATEGLGIPSEWCHHKHDAANIAAIYKKFGGGQKIKTFPMMTYIDELRYSFINGIEWVRLLNYMDYTKEKALSVLREVGYRAYEKKHYESVFTRFYQGYILPVKFKYDKRIAHYSNLICSGQMTRKEALDMMKKDPYDDPSLLREDKDYFLKKLGVDDNWFNEYLKAPSIPHEYYASSKKRDKRILRLVGWIKTFFSLFNYRLVPRRMKKVLHILSFNNRKG